MLMKGPNPSTCRSNGRNNLNCILQPDASIERHVCLKVGDDNVFPSLYDFMPKSVILFFYFDYNPHAQDIDCLTLYDSAVMLRYEELYF